MPIELIAETAEQAPKTDVKRRNREPLAFAYFGFVYRLPLAAAIAIAALGALALVPLGIASRVTDLALAFVLLNTAAIVAFFYFSVGKKRVWVP